MTDLIERNSNNLGQDIQLHLYPRVIFTLLAHPVDILSISFYLYMCLRVCMMGKGV